MNTSNNLDHKNKSLFLELLIKKLIVIFLLVLIAVVIFANTSVVQEDELVVITQFGKVERIISEPGLYFKLPLIQNTNSLTKKLSNYEAQSIKAFSKDKMNVVVTNYAVWKITEPHSFISNVQTIGRAEFFIESAVQLVVREKYSMLSYDEIIKGIAAGKDYNEDITQAVKKQLQGTGIDIVDVRPKRTGLPTDEEEAVFARIKADREKIAKQYISMAENQASEIKAEADKEAKIIISNAYAASEKIKGQADAEAAKIYAKSYNQDPEFYKFIRTLESYKKTLKGKPTIILPIDSPYTKYLIGK
jgi:membrane protease subunit HflC